MTMKKILSLLLALVLCVGGMTALAGCGDSGNKVVIYSSDEDYINEYFLERLKAQFPDYKISIEYLSTGKNAAKLQNEGKNTPCDIVWGLEVGYLDKMTDLLADISSYSKDHYLEDMQMGGDKYLVAHRYSGCMVVNTKVLKDKGLATPTSYKDLLDPQYKGLVSMPDPSSSGTGYIFLKSMVNKWGEDAAFSYFQSLKSNIKDFTSSGSGPINDLLLGEVVVALGMTSQAVLQKNAGQPLEIIFDAEVGAPYTACGYGIVEGKQDKQAVKDVFDFFYNTLVQEEKDKFLPEFIFKGQEMKVEGYPTDIPYADMNTNTASEKERLLGIWNKKGIS